MNHCMRPTLMSDRDNKWQGQQGTFLSLLSLPKVLLCGGRYIWQGQQGQKMSLPARACVLICKEISICPYQWKRTTRYIFWICTTSHIAGSLCQLNFFVHIFRLYFVSRMGNSTSKENQSLDSCLGEEIFGDWIAANGDEELDSPIKKRKRHSLMK